MSLATENSITIDSLDPSATGVYWCEVSLETPIFTAASPPHQLTVVCEYKYDLHCIVHTTNTECIHLDE
ncbi:unnamed protein product [Diatraea saccharalis]|uniref:Uncharacterized protein n=1 Tax=Diatraea saccharalis TaxID=40085 RepID=A0A9N9QXT8_9NEOP|nr:unnamed protein product [Diatraea saccharalis]